MNAFSNASMKTLITGSITLALAVATSFLVAFPNLRNPADIFWAFGVGVVFALAIFAPIAAAFAYRTPLRRWLAVHGSAVQWYASILMAVSLGYLLASARHRSSDAFAALALLVVFLCALAKVVFAIVFRTRNEPPSSDSGGPLPRLAPVPRPPGDRPPVLSATAEMKQEPAV